MSILRKSEAVGGVPMHYSSVAALRGDPPQQNAKKRQYGPKIIFNVSKRA